MKTVVLSMFALIAFAGNSVLCRLALADERFDPTSFTVVRLFAGAIMLSAILLFSKSNKRLSGNGSWLGAFWLFLYAALFSFAYITLDTATGALILFGSVQLTMIAVNRFRGNRLVWLESLGFIVACSGLLVLLWPLLAKPSLIGFLMMLAAGAAWAGYTLQGLRSEDALGDTASNFVRAAPLSLLLIIPFYDQLDWQLKGILLAIASGALTSGLGYALWYAALRGLSTTQAAVIQLLVPVIAAVGGVLFAGELISVRLVYSSVLVLGGIMLLTLAKRMVNVRNAQAN